jgi:DHA2 family multidrug resistance protein
MRSVEGISAVHGGEEVKFLPLTLVSLGSLPKSEVGSGSGFFNLSRQLGGSFGVAGFTLVLDYPQALELLTRQVDMQAALLAYGDVFRAIAVLFVLAIPLVLLMGRASQPQAG